MNQMEECSHVNEMLKIKYPKAMEGSMQMIDGKSYRLCKCGKGKVTQWLEVKSMNEISCKIVSD